MAWTTMHFAVGMGCAGALAGTACVIFRRGWRYLPAAMTAGGVWALVPDMPRVFREDFPSLPFASVLGDSSFERALHRVGDLFCFHNQLDAQTHQYALAGFALVLILYNLSIGLLMFLEHRERLSIGNRAWNAHQYHLVDRSHRKRRRGRHKHHDHHHTTQHPPPPVAPEPAPEPAAPLAAPQPPAPPANWCNDDDPVIHRINPDDVEDTG